MPITTYVGETVDLCRKEYLEWKIPNYFTLSQRTDTCYASLPFKMFNAMWSLRIYPNGERENNSVGKVGIYLKLVNAVLTYSVTFTLGIKGLKKNIQLEPKTFLFCCSSSNCFGWEDFVTRIDLQRFLNKQQEVNTLVVYCDASTNIVSAIDTACQTTFHDSLTLLCRDFGDLLQSGRKSDITIKVQGHLFKVHKLILEARSPVFSAMFNHDMKETRDRIVEIDDCDPDFFQDFLQYMYTGKLGNITQENAIHLFTIADKYCMTELRDECAEFMAVDLSVDNACDVLVAADRHNQTELKKYAEELLVKNMKKVLLSDKWKSFMVENTKLAVEILAKVIPDDSH